MTMLHQQMHDTVYVIYTGIDVQRSDLMDVINSSAVINMTQAVGNMDGTVIVPSYDWTTFLAEHIDKCVGIKSFHHLRFTAKHKGHVFAREKLDSEGSGHKPSKG